MKILIIGIDNILGIQIAEIASEKNFDVWAVSENDKIAQQRITPNIHMIYDNPSTNGNWLRNIPSDIDAYILAWFPSSVPALIYNPHQDSKILLDITHNLTNHMSHNIKGKLYNFIPAHLFETSNIHQMANITSDSSHADISQVYKQQYTYIKTKNSPQIMNLIYNIIYSQELNTLPVAIPISGRFPVVTGHGDNLISPIHVEDLARITLQCVEKEITQEYLFCCDDMAVEQKTIIETCAYIHNLMPSIPIPEIIAQRLFPYRALTWSRGVKMSNRELKTLGIFLKFPNYKAGLGIA